MASLEKYDPPKNQLPSKVHRFPLYRRQKPAPAPAPPPAKKDKPDPPPSPEWSKWQRIEGPQWDGYWRASSNEDGGWTYQFTKDGSVIWQQKPVASEAASSSPAASAKNAVKTSPAPALKPSPSPTPPSKPGQHSKPATKITAAPTVPEIPSFTVKKPAPPPPAPKKVVGSITLPAKKKGKHVTLHIPDPKKPVVVRRVLEK